MAQRAKARLIHSTCCEPPVSALISKGAGVSPEIAKRAVAMLEADALQVHLNVPQELAMIEGERSFRGWLSNIASIVKQLPVPLIVKEVGFGLSTEVIRELKQLGVQHFDIGGSGGTNFITIEERRRSAVTSGLTCWGIPTPCATIEAAQEGIPGELISTGGITSPHDCAKAIALGATAVGVAGHFLRTLCQQSEDELLALLEQWKLQLQQLYLMCGARNRQELRQTPVIITGYTKEWLEQRGISPSQFAMRSGRPSNFN